MATYKKLLKNKNGDTIIPVTDIISDYSTNEIDTGCTWVDGKKIYKKTIYIPALPNAGILKQSLGVSVDRVIQMFGQAKSATLGAQLPIPSSSIVNITYNIDLTYLTDANEVQVRTGDNRSSFDAYVTVIYTKTGNS